MKPKTMILMGLAIACGLGASYMTSRLLADRVDAEVEMVEVLVAKKDLNVGQHLAKPEEFFEVKAIPKELDKMENIRSLDALKGKILKQARNKGEAVAAQNLFDKDESLGIPKGYQAVGLRVNLETSAHGLATLPHSRVDVLYTQRGQNIKDSKCFYLLQNILVLAADGKIERDGVTAVAQVVTLALKPEDVQRLNLAKDTGTINLSLRNLGDDTIREVAVLTYDKLLQRIGGEQETTADDPTTETPAAPKAQPSTKPDPAVEPNPEAPKGTQFRLDIINGTRQSSMVARIHEGRIINEEHSPQPARPATPQPRKTGPTDQ
jgi:Flp pilus assembly protein CpaB